MFSQAIDTVNHRILLDKLEHFGIRGLALEWIKCYLYNRHQYVEFNVISSSFHEISRGGPQGSVLGPLFFLIINDLCQISNIYDLVLFADDTNLFFSQFESTTSMNLVNSGMLKLSDWFKANKLSLNIQKSNYITFKPRQRRDELTLSIEMDDLKMNQVKEVNFLGVILDETLSWKPPISQVASLWALFVNLVFALLEQVCVLYTIPLFILIFNVAF